MNKNSSGFFICPQCGCNIKKINLFSHLRLRCPTTTATKNDPQLTSSNAKLNANFSQYYTNGAEIIKCKICKKVIAKEMSRSHLQLHHPDIFLKFTDPENKLKDGENKANATILRSIYIRDENERSESIYAYSGGLPSLGKRN